MANFSRIFLPVLLVVFSSCSGSRQLSSSPGEAAKDQSVGTTDGSRQNTMTGTTVTEAASTGTAAKSAGKAVRARDTSSTATGAVATTPGAEATFTGRGNAAPGSRMKTSHQNYSPAAATDNVKSASIPQDTIRGILSIDDLDRYDTVFLSLQDPERIFEASLTSLGADTICIIGTGDIMPGTNYPDSRYLPPGNDCAALFDPVRKYLASADVAFGNLEGVFCAEGGTPKNCKDPSVCYVFRMPDAYLDCILDAGYDVLSVANNHVNDFGPVGRASTARLLEEAGVPFAGFRSKPYTTFEKDGVTYGFAAFAPHTGTVDLKDYKGAAAIVAMLDSISDVVIVSFHGGAEGRDHQHVPCTDEIYLGYNRGNVCTFARTVVDAGADVVFGHGPHVIRGMELYKDRLICYSLGNFCTYARFNLSGPNGLAPIVKVFTDPDGRFLEGRIIPVYQSGEGGPRLDPRKLAIIKLQELSASDFPDSPLVIGTDGRFYAE